MRALLLLLAFTTCAVAQDVDVHRQVLQRQQASDAFAQQLRQSQEVLRVPSSSASRQGIEALHLSERQRLDNVSAAQQRDASIDRPAELRPVERQIAADERRPYVLPSGGIIEVVRPKACDRPRPLVTEREPLPIDARRSATTC